MNRKVTVVGGAGNVGATVARGVADKQLADVVVIDIADQKAAGVALDMLEACPIYGLGQPRDRHRRLRARAPTPTSSSSRRACRASRA